MTISPPSKVKTRHTFVPEVLLSGIDTYDLGLYINWKDSSFLEHLEEHKGRAQVFGKSVALPLEAPDYDESILLNMYPNGSKRFRWLLIGNQYTLKIMNSEKPNSSPNCMVEIRSETIHHLGIRQAIEMLIHALENMGATIIGAKPSRMDLYMDILIPVELWNLDLFTESVSRSRKTVAYSDPELTGFSFGKGDISCRFYDKAHEVETISRKMWMYCEWGFNVVPDGMKVIRIEFQLRRPVLKELALNSIEDSLMTLDRVWAYCTQDWLKFQSNPGKHHTQRKPLPWWNTIQNIYLGVCDPSPAIRSKAIRTDQDQLAKLAIGAMTSFAATYENAKGGPYHQLKQPSDLIEYFKMALYLDGATEEDLEAAINSKRAKYYRGRRTHSMNNRRRQIECLPTDLYDPTIEEIMSKEMGAGNESS